MIAVPLYEHVRRMDDADTIAPKEWLDDTLQVCWSSFLISATFILKQLAWKIHHLSRPCEPLACFVISCSGTMFPILLSVAGIRNQIGYLYDRYEFNKQRKGPDKHPSVLQTLILLVTLCRRTRYCLDDNFRISVACNSREQLYAQARFLQSLQRINWSKSRSDCPPSLYATV